jgi:hypothetical protein
VSLPVLIRNPVFRACLVSASDVVTLTRTLIRLSLDPESAPLHTSIENAVHALIESVPAEDAELVSIQGLLLSGLLSETGTFVQRRRLCSEIVSMGTGRSYQWRLQILRTLPFGYAKERWLRRWIALGMNCDLSKFAAVRGHSMCIPRAFQLTLDIYDSLLMTFRHLSRLSSTFYLTKALRALSQNHRRLKTWTFFMRSMSSKL